MKNKEKCDDPWEMLAEIIRLYEGRTLKDIPEVILKAIPRCNDEFTKRNEKGRR